MKSRRSLSALLLLCAALLTLGLVAGVAAASSGDAGTSPTGTSGSAMNPSGNEECFACHGVKPQDGTITTADGQSFPATIDVAGHPKSLYVDRKIQSNSRHGQLACVSCHLGFNAGEHPPRSPRAGSRRPRSSPAATATATR